MAVGQSIYLPRTQARADTMLLQNKVKFFKKLAPLMLAALAGLVAISMILFPRHTFQAAFRGLDAWWSIVFPALLPFFVMSEVMMGLGVVSFMGVLLEPVMRPLFNVPGSGAFVFTMGYSSGAPIGAVLSADLRKKNLCSREEAQRLMAFTSNTSPLFLFGAVSVGMFHDAALGLTLALSHYLANITIGLVMGAFSRRRSPGHNVTSWHSRRGNLFIEACGALMRHQRKDGRPLGTLMADAVMKAAQTLSMIGGYIIFFSVFTEILKLLGVLDLLASFLLLFLKPFGLDSSIGTSLATGFFEVTLGAKLSSEVPTSLSVQLLAVSAILGWGGLSIHAQVASIIKDTDLKMHTFVLARVFHSFLAPVFTFFLMDRAAPVFNSLAGHYSPPGKIPALIPINFGINFLTALLALVLILMAAALGGATLYAIKNLYRWYRL